MKERVLLAWLVSIFLFVSMVGCGGGGSSSTVDANEPTTVGDSVISPFGAESITDTQYDNDGKWTERSTTDYTYDEEGRVTAVTATTEWDYDGDGIVDKREVTTAVIDPTITVPEESGGNIRGLRQKRPGAGSAFPGAILSATFERYEQDDGGALQFTQTWTRTYEYDANGNQTMTEYTSQRDNNGDYVLDRTETRLEVSTYNASGQRLTYENTSETDDDGDGNPEYITGNLEEYDSNGKNTYSQSYTDGNGDGIKDSIYTHTYTFTYDPQGNMTREDYLFESDGNGDGTPESTTARSTIYTNSYDSNENLVQVVRNQNGSIYTYDYTYDDTGRVTSRTETNDSDGNGDPNGVEIYTYNYNELGQLEGYTYISQNYRYLDIFTMVNTLTQVSIQDYTYTYDASGNLVSIIQVETADSSSPTFPITGDPDSQYTYTLLYSYDADGHLVDFSQLQEEDRPFGGAVENSSSYGFSASYNPGDHLTAHEYWEDWDNNGLDDYLRKFTFSFNADGQVDMKVYEDDTDYNGVTDYIETTTYSYDDSGLLTAVTVQINDGGVVTDGMNGTFDYEGNVVTANLDLGNGSGPAEFRLDYGDSGVPVGISNGEWLSRDFNVTTRDNGYREYYDYIAPSPDLLALLLGTAGNVGGGESN